MQNLSEVLGRYNKLNEAEKKLVIDEAYNSQNLSWTEIANMAGTYPNKILRDARKLGIKSKSRSEAQKLALQTGRHKHPTKGVGHSEESKAKIGDSLHKSWEDRGEDARTAHAEAARKRWNERSPEEIAETRKAALDAIRQAATDGSNLEKYLLKGIIAAGYRPEFHKERWVIRQALQIDIFVPEINTAIEVDGPSHFKDIWGSDTLQKNQKRDAEKNGLLLQRGCCIVRIKQSKGLTKKFKRDTLASLLKILESIKKRFPPQGERQFVIGEES